MPVLNHEIIIIIIIIITHFNNDNNNITITIITKIITIINFPEIAKYCVDVQQGIVSSHGERDPL